MIVAPETVKSLTTDVLALVRRAGARIVEIYASDYEVVMKPDETPLTTADLAAHHIIVDGLLKLTPEWPVLSEESAPVAFEERQTWDAYWLVDPLDGTREFLRRNGEFVVSIALVVGHRPVLGVIQAPVLDVAYFARHGAGAFKQKRRDPATRIHCRKSPDKVTVARSRCPETGPRQQSFLNAIGQHDEIAMGSALKSCLVAEGSADVYARLGPTGEWDTAAAQCIVEEAGGCITDMGKQPLRYNTRDSLINPHFVVYGDGEVAWTDFVQADPACNPV